MARKLLLLCCSIILLCAGRAAAQTANFTWTPTSGCSPAVITFTSTSTGTISGYSWSFGNGSSSTNQNPSTTYTSPGTYTVTLTVTGSGGTNTHTASIIIYGPPTASFTVTSTPGCAPRNASFAATATANAPGSVTYSWDFGDGNTLSSGPANVSHTYTSTGTFTVSLTVTNSYGCTTFVSVASAATVYGKPSSAWSAAQTLYCHAPAAASFSASTGSGSGPFTYAWTFGNGGSNSGATPSNTYNSGGSYTVTLITTDANGCKDTSVRPSYINVHVSTASFSAPTSICQSKSPPSPQILATFTNTSSGATATYWDFGDGGADSGISVTHAYQTSGTITVRMITDVGGCSDTVYHQITVNPIPATTFTYSPSPNCPPPVTISYAPNASGGSYAWIGNSPAYGSWSMVGNPGTHSYSFGGAYDTVRLVVTSAAGCSDTSSPMIVGINLPFNKNVSTAPDHGCAPLLMIASNALWDVLTVGPYSPAPISTTWSWGDGSPNSSGASANHTYQYPGTYHRVVTTITPNGCTVIDTFDVHVGQKVHPSFTFTPDSVCPHVQVYFTNTTVTSPGALITYTWNVGAAYTVINNRDATLTYFRPGTYSIYLYADSNGCLDTAVCTNCLTVLPSNANFVYTIGCSPNDHTLTFYDSSIGASSYQWSFGDGGSSTIAQPVHTYAANGSYTIRLITHNNQFGCTDTMIQYVTISSHVLTLAASKTTLCAGDSLQLTPTVSGLAGITGLDWFIDGSNNRYDSMLRPTTFDMVLKSASRPRGLLAPITGWHSVMYVVNSSSFNNTGCHDTFTAQHYFFVSQPLAAFGASSQIGCTPFAVTFTDSSSYTPGAGPASRSWLFGNGSGITNNNLSTICTYTAAGLYNVKLTIVDSNGCVDSAKKTNYIEARHPTANFGALTTATCIGSLVQFSNASTGVRTLHYAWSFGDGGTSAANAPTHTYTAVGSYTVRLIVTDTSGCSDTMIKTGYIAITRPHADFTMDDSLAICPPLAVHFTSTSTNAGSYDWDLANGNSSTNTNAAASYTASGIYHVRLIVFDGNGCPDTAIHDAKILGYAGAFTYTPLNGCAPLTVNFTSSITSAPSLIWDFSDGDTALAHAATISHIYRAPGAYVPKILFSDGTSGCKASSIGLDTIKVDGVIAGFKALPPCERSTIQLVDTSYSYFSAKTAWSWHFDNGQNASGASVPHFYAAAGSYPVTLVVANAQGCKDSVTRNVTIYPLPVITACADTAVCVPDAATLSATGGISYTWSPATTLSCAACNTPSAAPTTPTLYFVTGTDQHGCANRDSVKIAIQTKTTFTSNTSGAICLGEHYVLSAEGAMIYSWTPAASLDSPTSPHPTATPAITTTYIVTAKEGSCLADTHTVKVIVHPLPTAYAGEDAKMIAGRSTLLQASGMGIDHILWSPDSTLSCNTCFAPEARPKVSTTYLLKTFTNFGCSATDSVRIFVLCDGSQLFIPNTFTPNNDGQNDYFFPRGQGLAIIKSMRIYSRWGEKVFEVQDLALNDERRGWNGNFAGRQLTPDTYVYVIEATCDSGDPINWKGDVTLIR